MVGRDDDDRRRHGGRRNGHDRGWRGYGSNYDLLYYYPTYAYPAYPTYYVQPPQQYALALPQETTMTNQYNPYNPYNPYAQQYAQQYAYPYNQYGMVGQDEVMLAGPPPGALARPGGFVPVGLATGPIVPAISSNLPTRRVLGEVDIVETPGSVLAPVLGVVQRTQLLPGFKHASKKVCGKSCSEIKLKTDLPFRIERLWVDSHDSCKFDITAIIVGQRVLSTGSHFSARYLKRGNHRHGFHFPLTMDLDQQHPLRILVRNKSGKERKIRIVAWGTQLAE